MGKIKKCLLIIIMSILCMMILQGKSQAFTLNDLLNGTIGVGDTVTLEKNDMYRGDIYCIQHNVNIANSMTFTVYQYARIFLNDVSYYTLGNGWWYSSEPNNNNGTLAYILNKKGGYKQNGVYTPTQRAIYNFIGQWNSTYNYLPNLSNTQTEESENLIQEAQSYATRIGDSKASITDKTNKDNISVAVYGENGTEYMRVGPFNWEFKGNLTAISVKSDNGEIQNVRYSKFDGLEEKFIDKTEIKSLENFYITIEAGLENSKEGTSLKYTKITGIDATVSITYSDAIEAELWRLTKDDFPQYQNLILARTSTKPFSDEAKATFDYDIKLTKNIEIYKVGTRDGQKKPLAGVAFIVKSQEMNKYVRIDDGKLLYVDSKEKATEFVTNKKGIIKIEGLLISTYEVFETVNPNYGYVLSEGEKVIEYYDDKRFEIENLQVYVKISGFIWEDSISSNKASGRNNLYSTSTSTYTDDKDKAFNGIIVRLKSKKTGKIVKNERTGKAQEFVSTEYKKNKDDKVGLYSEIDGGEYIFEGILIDNLSDYYIEFEYDGLIYQSVVLPEKVADEGISPYDKKNVSKASDEEERVILDKNFASVNATGQNAVDVKDAEGNTKYNITYNDTVNNTTSRKDSSDCVVHAKTNDEGDGSKNLRKDLYDYFEPFMEEIRYINLGLFEKPKADLSLTQDLKNINVGVNGYWHVYNYEERSYDESAYKIDDDKTWNVGVKFKNSFKGTYMRAIYKSDYEYTSDDKSKELTVDLTYKIYLTNESSYYTRVNSIVDYYDSRFELKGIGKKLDENNSIMESINYDSNVTSEYDNYNKVIIDVDSILGINGKSEYIYIQFRLNREATISIMNLSDEELSYNRAEIISYTVLKDDKENTVAAVDRDSVPGNANINKSETYEDDIDSAPPVRLEIGQNARQIEGTVFEDYTEEEIKTGLIRQGDGRLGDNDTKISNVKVTLNNEDGTIAKIYNANSTDENNKWKEAVTVTDGDGNFKFEGYIPGKYTITYIWGDKTYTVQDYKATIYNDLDRQYKTDVYNDPWYKQEDPRYSDAFDNYEKRLEIDAQMVKIKDNTIRKQIESAYEEGYLGEIVTSMDSTTPIMEFSVEYETNETDGMDNKVVFSVRNVDFGIVERARQQLDITKRVESFKITLANGQVLVDTKIDEEGNLSSHDYVTYMGPSVDNEYLFNGYIKAEIDNELIEGARLEVVYKIEFINNSEKDYTSENYYKYGIEEGSLVTLTPSAVVDYLDKDLGFEAEKNADWKQITEQDLADLKAVKVGNTEFLSSRTILYTEATAVPLEPVDGKNKTSVGLSVSKLLATSNDLTFDNDAETVIISKPENDNPNDRKTKGGIIKYFPVDTSEQVQVTPSTGEDRAYVIPTVVGITSLLILSVGIFIIKRKVIDNK